VGQYYEPGKEFRRRSFFLLASSPEDLAAGHWFEEEIEEIASGVRRREMFDRVR